MNSYFSEQYLTYFNKFVDQLKVFYINDDVSKILASVQELSNDDKLKNGKMFVNNVSDENFELFLQSKLKVFSHKNNDTKEFSESLFGSALALKQLLNNQTDELKKTIWAYLHVLYLYSYLLLPMEMQNETRVNKLSKLLDILDVRNINNNVDINSRIYNLLNVEVNDDTKTMIDDIVKSFNPLLESNNPNPLANIMQISQTISSKYSDKINNGEIELDKIMDSIKTKVPGMEGIINNFTNMKKNKKPKKKVIIDQDYSTANVEVINDETVEGNKTNFNIGKILKAADSLGLVPNMSNDNKQECQVTQDNSTNMPNMNQMMELLGKLQNGNIEDLDKEFSNIGLDMSALNKQLESIMKPAT